MTWDALLVGAMALLVLGLLVWVLSSDYDRGP